ERRFLATLVDNMSESIIACDADGKLTLVNQATRSLVGADLSNASIESIQDSVRTFSMQSDASLAASDYPIARALRGEVVRGQEVVVSTPNGERKIISSNAVPLRDDAGMLIGAVAASRDITDWKQFESAIRESEDRYRQLVDEAADA